MAEDRPRRGIIDPPQTHKHHNDQRKGFHAECRVGRVTKIDAGHHDKAKHIRHTHSQSPTRTRHSPTNSHSPDCHRFVHEHHHHKVQSPAHSHSPDRHRLAHEVVFEQPLDHRDHHRHTSRRSSVAHVMKESVLTPEIKRLRKVLAQAADNNDRVEHLFD
jgi:hypothetical protein